jgi:branched-chain amino acid transport system permease protein
MTLTSRGGMAAIVALALLAIVPFLLTNNWLTLLALVFLYAYWGQAWNIMMGFAGQLSLGHALYVGVGGYAMVIVAQGAGLTAWPGLIVAGLVTGLYGAIIGFLGFRFAVRGVYFALLTIAFAEFTRVLAENLEIIGGTGGYFLLAIGEENQPFVSLRGGATWFYYVFLILAVLVTVLAARLRYSRMGYYWLAIREDEDAARALGARAFRLKIFAVAISGALTGIGGALFALQQGGVFPERFLSIAQSIELIIAPIVGGLGTLMGPLVGAVVVIFFQEVSRELGAVLGVTGFNFFAYGLVVLLVIAFMPQGIWPVIARWLGIGGPKVPPSQTPLRRMLRGQLPPSAAEDKDPAERTERRDA